MKLKSIIALASVVVAGAAMAEKGPDQKCGSGSCSKKALNQKAEASCSKKEASCSKKEAACAKKEASCSKK